MSVDAYVAVDHALPQHVKQLIEDNAHAANPHLRGAHVADILETYDDHDGCLWFTEPLWADFGWQWKGGPIPIEFYRAAAIAIALTEWGYAPLNGGKALLPRLLQEQAKALMPIMALATELLARDAHARALVSEGLDRAVRDA